MSFHALRHLVNADSGAFTVLLCPRQVDVLNGVVRKDGRAQSHVFRCFLFQIDQHIAVLNRRRISERLLHEFDATRMHLSVQVRYLRSITLVLEQYHVRRIQTDDATLLVIREQALHEIEGGRVGVMTLSSEQGRDPTVRFRHEVVYDHQVLRLWVEQRCVQ